ncbi:hypothetical protein ACF1A5_05900 [Streptomyces sp. NPDC014864]|uniref:hypothetical protein n=1 Tax=Streptomyces sp. NPDC014864 TaxID=3364924 RepID=UPI0037029C3B
MLLSVVVMSALHIPLPLLVTGAAAEEVFSFAVSDPHRRDQRSRRPWDCRPV